VHLGALGVVTDLMLSIEPTFEVRQNVYEHLPWDQLTGSFDDVMAAGYSVSAITDFAGDDVDLLWVKSRVDGGASQMPPELFGARAATEKLHVTRQRSDALHPAARRTRSVVRPPPPFLLEFTPSSGAESKPST
jgi:xylitol oxidase